jgi:hypothetical protein
MMEFLKGITDTNNNSIIQSIRWMQYNPASNSAVWVYLFTDTEVKKHKRE